MNRGSKRLEATRKFIKDHWLLLTDSELAGATNLNVTSIRRLRYRMQLIRPHTKSMVIEDEGRNYADTSTSDTTV